MEKLQRKSLQETNYIKKFKKSRLHVDELCFKEARNIAENLIRKKKKNSLEIKLMTILKKPKELWKVLNDIGLPKKGSSGTQNICLKNNYEYVFDSTSTANIFKIFFSDNCKKSSGQIANLHQTDSTKKQFQHTIKV